MSSTPNSDADEYGLRRARSTSDLPTHPERRARRAMTLETTAMAQFYSEPLATGGQSQYTPSIPYYRDSTGRVGPISSPWQERSNLQRATVADMVEDAQREFNRSLTLSRERSARSSTHFSRQNYHRHQQRFSDGQLGVSRPPNDLYVPRALDMNRPHDWAFEPTLSVPRAAAHRPSPSLPLFMSPAPPVLEDAAQEAEPAPAPTRNEASAVPTVDLSTLPRYRRILTFFGYGRYATKARRNLVSLVWTLSVGFVQVTFIVALLSYASRHMSPTVPGENEWQACGEPLGVWNALWVGKVLLGCTLAYWSWKRDRGARAEGESIERGGGRDAEAGNGRPSERVRPPPTRPNQVQSGRSGPVRGSRPPIQRGSPSQNDNDNSRSNRPHARTLSRLSMLSSIVTLAWFVTAHALAYTSVNTCRHSSPHIWWLTFGIMCIMYFMIVEIIVLALVVFVIGPIVFLFWNIILILLGRHTLQNPHYIRPEIGKLPKTVVESIPLVLYIPPPPEPNDGKGGSVKYPPPVFSYPPHLPKPTGATNVSSQQQQPPRGRRRFAFLSLAKMKKKAQGDEGDKKHGPNGKEAKGQQKLKGEPLTWEDHWEKGEYPFVRLEENRASCAICLLDFEEPKKLMQGEEQDRKAKEGREAEGDGGRRGSVEEIPVERMSEEEQDKMLKLADAGEGPQPLRLLGCGHVFHKTCIDPWLTDVSGRCPVCQRPVAIPDPEKDKQKDSGRGNRRRRE